jgi:signal transduction histidine kinase
MRIVEAAILTSIGVGFVWVVWHLWQSRQAELRRAEQNEELAQLSRTMKGISHDLQNLLGLIHSHLSQASGIKPEDLQEFINDMERAARSASKLVEAARGSEAPMVSERSMEGITRLGVALMRTEAKDIHLLVDGDFRYRGTDLDAMRIVQNLLLNAVREARHVPHGHVTVRLDAESLRITNPIRRGLHLPASIWEPGMSLWGSTGVGLSVVRETATRIGLVVSHDVTEDEATFVLSPSATYRT